jgi:hypothetical protein
LTSSDITNRRCRQLRLPPNAGRGAFHGSGGREGVAVVLLIVVDRGTLGRMGFEVDGGFGQRRPARWWGRRPIVVAVAAVFVCVVAGLGGVGVVARMAAADAHSRNDRLGRELHGVERRERVRALRLERLVDGSGSVVRSLGELMAAVRDEAESSNRAVGVLNRGADLVNAGRKQDAVALLQGDGKAAVADLEAATNAVVDVVGTAQGSVADLFRGSGD